MLTAVMHSQVLLRDAPTHHADHRIQYAFAAFKGVRRVIFIVVCVLIIVFSKRPPKEVRWWKLMLIADNNNLLTASDGRDGVFGKYL